jgi:hypothetical protein
LGGWAECHINGSESTKGRERWPCPFANLSVFWDI